MQTIHQNLMELEHHENSAARIVKPRLDCYNILWQQLGMTSRTLRATWSREGVCRIKIYGLTNGFDIWTLSITHCLHNDLARQNLGASSKELHNVRHPCLLCHLTLCLLLESLADKQALLGLDIKDMLFNSALHDQPPNRCGALLSKAVDAI